MDDLSDPENAWERERWSRLLEMFIPLRERGTDRIIAVAELYLPPRDILAQVGDAQRTTWIVVSLAIVASAVLLFGIVKQGSDTIKRQEVALTRQVGELTLLVDHNAALSERVRTAAERSTTLNERSLRRVSADLHDGPGQMLSLALLRLDSMRDRAAPGRPPGAGRGRRGRGRAARGDDATCARSRPGCGCRSSRRWARARSPSERSATTSAAAVRPWRSRSGTTCPPRCRCR